MKNRHWHCRIHDTLCVNVGQDDSDALCFAVVEMTFPRRTACLPTKTVVRAYPWVSPQHCSPIRGSDRQTGSRWRWPGSPRTAPRNRTAPGCILSAHPEAAPQLRGFQPLFLRPRQWESAICVRSVNRLDLAPIVPHTQSSYFSRLLKTPERPVVSRVERMLTVLGPWCSGRSPRRKVSAVVARWGLGVVLQQDPGPEGQRRPAAAAGTGIPARSPTAREGRKGRAR